MCLLSGLSFILAWVWVEASTLCCHCRLAPRNSKLSSKSSAHSWCYLLTHLFLALQFHYAVFFAYIRLREQEIRNLMWISECVTQNQKARVHDSVVFIFWAPPVTLYMVVQNAYFDDGTISCTRYKPGTYYAHCLSFYAAKSQTWSPCIICFVVK